MSDVQKTLSETGSCRRRASAADAPSSRSRREWRTHHAEDHPFRILPWPAGVLDNWKSASEQPDHLSRSRPAGHASETGATGREPESARTKTSSPSAGVARTWAAS